MKTILFILILLFSLCACHQKVVNPTLVNQYPEIFPDYINVTIPSSIAPMNFDYIGAPIERIQVNIIGSKKGNLDINAKSTAEFPLKAWRELIKENEGDSLIITVSVKSGHHWKQFKPFAIYISPNPIDYGLVYRKIAPGYEVYSKMGIYERDLSNFQEKAILENTMAPGMCINCHSFNQADPQNISLHIRGNHGGTLIKQGNKLKMLNTKTDSTLSSCVYPYWHPSGEYITYSVNETRQSFHTNHDERIEVLDLASDIVVYHLKTNELIISPLLNDPNIFETFPVFAADGSKLYFCAAQHKAIPAQYKNIKYSLCSIDFDPSTGIFNDKIDTLFNSCQLNKSISFPRPSYNGKYLMFTLSDYGNFSIWHKEADLGLIDLRDNSIRILDEVNSDNTESFHNWDSQSQWFVFSSRRIDGLYTRLYLACINEDGSITKPFLLPQKKPKRYYDYSVYSYNVPDFIKEPIDMNLRETEKIIKSAERQQILLRQ